MQINPMNFIEYLMAYGDKNLVSWMDSLDNIEEIPDAFYNPLSEKLKMYFVTGGMPEAVAAWVKEQDIALVQEILHNILQAYERDFAKHPDLKEFPRISLIWKSIPSALAEGNRLFVEFKGALSENYVQQSLQNQFEASPRYWAWDNPRHEVDFLIQRENDIFPIEVKSEASIESKSLKKYKEKYADKTKLRVRFSMKNLHLDGDLLNIPLFMADYTDKLIGIALKEHL